MHKFPFYLQVAAQLIALLAVVPPVGAADTAPVRMISGTVELPALVVDAVRAALVDGQPSLPAVDGYAITDIRHAQGWHLASVVGLSLSDSTSPWNLMDNGLWFGLVILRPNASGRFQAAVEGSDHFAELVSQAPDTVLSSRARRELGGVAASAAPAGNAEPALLSAYRFPWEPGKAMVYGSRAVHDNGFAGVVTGWRAVDFLSDGDVGAGHAPNLLLASAAGTISYVCRDGTAAAVRVGGLFYTHLLDNAGLYVGRSLSQGEQLGQLRAGSFDDSCGWAIQGGSWFHVHWGFPNSDAFGVEDWTLNLNDGLWRRDAETRGTGSWISSGLQPAGDPFEPDNEPSAASPIDPGSTQRRSLRPVGDIDWVVFSLAEASGINLEAAGDESVEVWLYGSGVLGNETAEPIAGPGDAAKNTVLITLACSASPLDAGVYFVKINEMGNVGEIPAYDLTLTVVSCAEKPRLYLPLLRTS